MEELVSIVTRKGQVTIPALIRRKLRIKEGDKVSFIMENNEILLKHTGSIVERTAGMFKTRKPSLTAGQLREEAERVIGEETVERMRD